MQIKSSTYEEFIAKFTEKPKTTDDCYTPRDHYEKIQKYVHDTYNVEYDKMVRPFYPGSDYTSYDYYNTVVVDNPPFSIYSQIVRWYSERNIPFFLYAPGLTPIVANVENTTILIPNEHHVKYENGAIVRTTYITNMDDPEIVMRSMYLPDNKQAKKKESFPPDVISASLFNKYATYAKTDGEVYLKRSESIFTRKACGKHIYGDGYFVSSDFIKRYNIKPTENDMELTPEDYKKLLQLY